MKFFVVCGFNKKVSVFFANLGYFLTQMTQPLADNPAFDQWVKSRTPAARWGKPDELIGAAVFLASAASDFVAGQIIYVDGGMLACL